MASRQLPVHSPARFFQWSIGLTRLRAFELWDLHYERLSRFLAWCLELLRFSVFLDFTVVLVDDLLCGIATPVLLTFSFSERSCVKGHLLMVAWRCCRMSPATGSANNELDTIRFTTAVINISDFDRRSKHSVIEREQPAPEYLRYDRLQKPDKCRRSPVWGVLVSKLQFVNESSIDLSLNFQLRDFRVNAITFLRSRLLGIFSSDTNHDFRVVVVVSEFFLRVSGLPDRRSAQGIGPWSNHFQHLRRFW